MAEQKTTATTKPDVIERAKGFWAKYSKRIIIIGGVVIALGIGYLGYKYWYKIPRETEANDKFFASERLFAKMSNTGAYSKDSINFVLNGGNLEGTEITGALRIISKYSGTDAASRANFVAGACYLHLPEPNFDLAIKYLKAFDGNGAGQVESKAYTMLGDAYAEKKNNEEALKYYKKAAAALNEKDAGQKVVALFNVARFADYLGKTQDALDALHSIKENYMDGLLKADVTSQQQPVYNEDDLDKLLAKLGETK